MEIYNLLTLPVDDKEISRCFGISHVQMNFLLNRDVVDIKKYADALNILFQLRSDYLALVCLEHSVTGKHLQDILELSYWFKFKSDLI